MNTGKVDSRQVARKLVPFSANLFAVRTDTITLRLGESAVNSDRHSVWDYSKWVKG
jgi:hypothetical protein